ncbi:MULTISPECIES: succinylglutamate desuccinylase/aspartoacylase domain-containing protein [unclassified Pandoraea]|uniref:succinylglutamate desuccinylase/aspartoacylase domain-containing protein n=1 Tax=unclassified Pandoraea TaxID=2624094 RepID=UPI000B3FBE30|nr:MULTISPECIES: succinylglutamate desuccinylase/aspartoacylase family protein [unclassified Pandoraea]
MDTQNSKAMYRDISAYKAGNTGTDYVHHFDSGLPGPHLLISSLVHGNEFCGMHAVTHLLDRGVRPARGKLTLLFANVEAYESFDESKPFASRQLVHNLNRIWSDEYLQGESDSPEIRRMRELAPFVDAADHVLDIHSTSLDVPPFWVYPDAQRNSTLAEAIDVCGLHLIMPKGLGSGTPLIQFGRFGEAASTAGAAVVIECGQHFKPSSAAVAIAAATKFLTHFGLIEASEAGDAEPQPSARRRFELVETHVVQTPEFRFARPVIGFEVFGKDELVATDGDKQIVAPFDGCTVIMPTREPIVGREAMYLARERV